MYLTNARSRKSSKRKGRPTGAKKAAARRKYSRKSSPARSAGKVSKGGPRTVTSRSGKKWQKTASGQWVTIGGAGGGERKAGKAKKGRWSKAKKSYGERKGYATRTGGATSKGVRASISASKDIDKATAILRAAKAKVSGIPRGAIEEILKLLKYALDT